MQARLLPAARGAFWIAAGFNIYRRNPPLLSMLTFGNMLLALVFSQMQPIGPFLLLLFSPMVMALIANACGAIAQNGLLPLPSATLLTGLREHSRLLLRLGVVQMAYVMIVVLLFDLLLPSVDPNVLVGAREAADSAEGAAQAAARLDAGQLGLLLLHLGAIGLAVLPAFWFAPLLTAWHGVTPFKSVFFSLVAVWRNWRAFLVYATASALVGVLAPAMLLGLLGLLSGSLGGVIATVLQLLLLLVFAPVLMTGAYCSYNDIFAPVTSASAEVATGSADSSDDASSHE